jgi:precorrin-6Y C5,15-methyltransferase (decarboxylating)
MLKNFPEGSADLESDVPSSGSSRSLGLSDEALEQRRPLRGQITKREVRAVALYSLGLRPDSVVWDIGAGTGSVSVEAALIAHRGTVYAIERDEDSIGLLERNVDKYSPGNVRVVIGEAPQALESLPDPDSVFVGGSGGQLTAILDAVVDRLRPQGRIVVNLIALERTQEVYHRLKDLGFAVGLTQINAARGKELPDATVRLESMNPVFVVTAHRGVPDEELK